MKNESWLEWEVYLRGRRFATEKASKPGDKFRFKMIGELMLVERRDSCS